MRQIAEETGGGRAVWERRGGVLQRPDNATVRLSLSDMHIKSTEKLLNRSCPLSNT